MLPEFPTEPRELPWQPKLGKNKSKLHRFQLCTSYGDNACMYFDVGEYNYANKNFKGVKGVTIATKFTQNKNKNAQISVCARYSDTFYVYDRIFAVVEFKMLSEFFREQRALPWQPKLSQNKPKLHKL